MPNTDQNDQFQNELDTLLEKYGLQSYHLVVAQKDNCFMAHTFINNKGNDFISFVAHTVDNEIKAMQADTNYN